MRQDEQYAAPDPNAPRLKGGVGTVTQFGTSIIGMEKAADMLDQMEGDGYTANKDFWANVVDDIPMVGKPIARGLGGKDYQKYNFAKTAYTNLLLKAMSGQQVTTSEEDRWVAASAAQINDHPDIIRAKGQFRRLLIESAKAILEEKPFDKDFINAQADLILAQERGELDDERLKEIQARKAEIKRQLGEE